MKILHINYSLDYGGIETMLVNIVNEQVRYGHEIYILVLWNHINKDLVNRLDKRIRILPVNRPKGNWNPFYVIKANYFLLKTRPDIVHVHSAKLIDYIFLPWLRKKMCVTQHRMCNGVGFDRLPKYAQIFAISSSVKKDIKKTLNLESKVVYNGIQPSLIKCGNDKYSKEDRKFHIVQVGRLYHQDKGQHILVRAIKEIIECGIKNICVDFIGDGPSRHYIQELIKEQGVEPYCNMLGEKTPEYIYEHLHKYDIEVQPSLSEGFGLTAAEAMAAQIPVLVSDQEALLEVIDNGSCGYYFKTGDYVELSQKLIEIMRNNSNSKLLAAGKERVSEFFDVKITAKNYLNNYKELKI